MDKMSKKPTIIQGNNPEQYEPIHSAEDYVAEEDYLKAKDIVRYRAIIKELRLRK